LKFKKGDKVVLLKKIQQREFDNFGNEYLYIEKAKTAKYLTIKFMDEESYQLSFYEIPQWWRLRWFKRFNAQLELNFDN
jgi:hypothetical protein